jgi:signal transduction histidine kinase
MISHDLKGPLVTIQVFASMIKKELAAGNHENILNDLTRIKDGAAKMSSLVNHLLALARRIVEAHDGRIWVESEGVGKGSRFCFSIGTRPKA